MNSFLRSFFSCAALAAAAGYGATAARAAQQSDDPRQPRAKIIEDALCREANGPVEDRRDLLRPAMTQGKTPELAYWESGFVFDARHKQWLTPAEVNAQAARDPRLAAYEKFRDEHSDSIAGHLDVARWCLAKKLQDQAEAHLTRVLELDPNQAEARRLLGYRLERGSWQSDKETADAQAKARKAANNLAKWKPKLEKLHSAMQSGSRSQKAQRLATLKAIRDPAAIGAIDAVFCARGGDDMLLGISLLENLQSAESAAILARYAVFSPWDTVGKRAAQALRSQQMQDYVPLLLAGMESRDYSRAELYQGQGAEQYYYRQLFLDETDAEDAGGGNSKPRSGRPAQVASRTLFPAYQQPRAPAMPTMPTMPSLPEMNVPASDPASQSALATSSTASLDDPGFRTIMRAVERGEGSKSANSSAAALSRRLAAVLGEATGESKLASSTEWWNWWYDENDCLPPTPEYRVSYTLPLPSPLQTNLGQWQTMPGQVLNQSQYQIMTQPPAPLPLPPRTRLSECFAAGTVVWTESGPRAIEKIKMGERVFACDPESGCLALKVVLRPTVRPPTELYNIRLDAEQIRSTGGHCFWVSGRGWMMARDLEPGMNVHTLRGTATVAGVKKDKTEAAYNLVVEGFHSYFAGRGKYLTHDNTIRRPTDRLVPGLVASK